MGYPVPFNEPHRVRALHACNVLDSEADPAFDAIAEEAREEFGTPIAFISFVDNGRQWFKSKIGPMPVETTRKHAVCSYAIAQEIPLIVPDLAVDERFRENPYVVGPPGLRFYAGAPITIFDSFRIGTICICDTFPREGLSAENRQRLAGYAQRVAKLLEQHMGLSGIEFGRTAKKDFLHLMSHECRTPLNAIIGFCEMIEAMSSEEKVSEYASYALSSSRHLLDIIERILTFSQIESGNVDLQEKVVCCNTLLEDVMHDASGAADRSSVGIRLETSKNLPKINADEEQLRVMLQNLMDNAVKAASSSVSISAGLDEGGRVEITVTDDGGGIDKDAIVELLKPFEISGAVFSRKGEGIGLGLPLTQRLAWLHGGDFQLRNREDDIGGLVATITLPKWRVVHA